MSTRDQIAASVSLNLNDAAQIFSTSTSVNNSIQDGYDEVSAYCGQIEKGVALSFSNNLVYYDLSVLIPDFLCVTAIYNNNTRRWLYDQTTKNMDMVRWDWELWIGEPYYWIPISYQKIALVPHQTNASGNFTVFYRAQADTLVSNSTPKILSDSVKLLEFYATDDLLAVAKEFKKGQIWRSQYNEQLERYLDDNKLLAKPDRFLTFLQADLNYPRMNP